MHFRQLIDSFSLPFGQLLNEELFFLALDGQILVVKLLSEALGHFFLVLIEQQLPLLSLHCKTVNGKTFENLKERCLYQKSHTLH